MADKRFVAHIDILGMTSLVRRDAELAWRLLSDLASVSTLLKQYGLQFPGQKEYLTLSDRIWSVMFSDTIILFTKDDSDQDLHRMLVAVAELFHKALYRGVPVRVGLAFGDFFFNLDNSMYLGPALIDAYHLGEESQWMGIVVCDEVFQRSTRLNIGTGTAAAVIKELVPSKEGECERSVVNWPMIFRSDLSVNVPISVELFYEAFRAVFGPFEELPPTAQSKYKNTVAFVNRVLLSTN